MGKFKPYNKGQQMLFPPSLEELVPEGDLARVVDEIVEVLDSRGIERQYSSLGQRAYHPKMLLKLLFYGYATGVRSGRKIAWLCERDVSYMYLSRMYRPDFRTINDFRKRFLPQIRDYFIQIVRLAKQMGLIRMGNVMIDGTKIKANASDARTRSLEEYKKWAKQIEEELKKSIEIDEEEDRKYGKDKRGDELPESLSSKAKRLHKIKEAIEKLKEEERSKAKKEGKAKGKRVAKMNLTDPDARFMKNADGRIRTSYNCQIAVNEEGFIIGAKVSNEANDRRQLKGMIKEVGQVMQEGVKEVTADSGYSSYENYEYLEGEGIKGWIPDQYNKKPANRWLRFPIEEFKYEKQRDEYLCPGGRRLKRWKVRRDERKNQVIYRSQSCKGCLLKSKCTRKEARTLSVDVRYRLLQEMRSRVRSKEGRKRLLQRAYVAEGVFGNIKQNLGFRQFSVRGKEKVEGEFILQAIGHNLRKLASYGIFGWGKKGPFGEGKNKKTHIFYKKSALNLRNFIYFLRKLTLFEI